jgi:hypothetical protein
MKEIESRPFPVNQIVIVRSAFFALAKIGAELQSYDENQGIITARIARVEIGGKKIFGEEDIEISVEERDTTSFLKLAAPKRNVSELLHLISTYSVEGPKAIKDDAHSQWVSLLKDEENIRKHNEQKRLRQEEFNSFVNKIPLIRNKKGQVSENPSENDDNKDFEHLEDIQDDSNTNNSQFVAVLNPETKAIRPIEPSKLELMVPPSPGMLIKNRTGQIFEIQVDSMISFDRATHLLVCPYCFATNLQGSWYCSRCGKQQNIKAAFEELKKKAKANANASLTYAIIGLIPYVLLFTSAVLQIFLLSGLTTAALAFQKVMQAITQIGQQIGQQRITTVLPLFIFIALPGFLLGRMAISRAQSAFAHINLSFYADQSGRTKSNWGQAIGYFEIFLAVAIVMNAILNNYLIFLGVK